MTNEELERLEALAMEAVGLRGPLTQEAFDNAATPDAILSLIQRVKGAEAHVERLQMAVGEATKTAWAQGRAEALEEAAMVAEDYCIDPLGPYEVQERIAAAIRALGEKAP